jgi:hypothetical protein
LVGVLGILDGLSALVSAPNDPEITSGIVGIIIGSTFKGLLVGVLTGWFSRKVNSLPAGIAVGLVLGCAFAWMIAASMGKYYLEIILPGSVLGVIVGFATQRYGIVKPAATV